MIVGSENELTELKNMVEAKRAEAGTAINTMQGNDKSAFAEAGGITAGGASEKSCSALNSSLMDRETNDKTLRSIHGALRALGEYTPARHAELDAVLDIMKDAVAKQTAPAVQACETSSFQVTKLPTPAGR